MNVLPQASATGNIHSGTISGKLNGVIPATTPIGWRSECMSTPVATPLEKSPLRRWGMPVANSTTSIPRWSDARASAITLPCSLETVRAIRSALASSSSDTARARAPEKVPSVATRQRMHARYW